jgi:2-polyprenyl-3-methyl-5-hydroxy-6-metoxy-1,4-benzoquinol methylase
MGTLFKRVWDNQNYKVAFIKYIIKASYSHKLYTRIDKLVSIAINNNTNNSNFDIELMEVIKKYILAYKCNNINRELTPKRNSRHQDRIRLLKKFTQGQKITNYCDIGCGDGALTQEIGNEYNSINIYGIDTYPIDDKLLPVKIINGAIVGTLCKNVNYVQNTTINHINIKFDLITIFMSLHHIDPSELSNTLLFARNALSRDGILLIREHDVNQKKNGINDNVCDNACNNATSTFLQLVHLYNDDHSNCYFKSAEDWIEIVIGAKFTLFKILYYDEPNPQRIFHVGFKIG